MQESRLIYIVPVCYVKTGRYGKPSNVIISLHRKKISIITPHFRPMPIVAKRSPISAIAELLLCFSLDYFVLVLYALDVLDLVSSVLSQEIGWEERLRSDLFVSRET